MTTPPPSTTPFRRALNFVLPGRADEGEAPLPPRHFQWYLLFWHIIYLGSLGVALGLHLWSARAGLGWRQAAMVLLVAGQVGCTCGILLSTASGPCRCDATDYTSWAA